MSAIHEGGTLGAVYTDAKGKIIDVSQSFCDHFLENKESCLGKYIHQLIHEQEADREIIAGQIGDVACLFRMVEQSECRVYYVLLRIDEVDLRNFKDWVARNYAAFRAKREKSSSTMSEIVGESEALVNVKELAAKIATSDSTVLLSGESGTGKELFAQAIHESSSRSNHPFIAVNCVAIPDELFESEIFGYEAGAFSGAKKGGKPGKIELAQHGTLFLDEISELSYLSQGKLMRVLQEREVERLGGTHSVNVDIRVIAATNKNLQQLVQAGKFREDLFYRLYVFDLHIPSLRDRKGDLMTLARTFIEHFNHMLGRDVEDIAPKLQSQMLAYDWPGNVRELRAFIERGMNITEGSWLEHEHVSFSTAANHPTAVGVVESSNTHQRLDEIVQSAEKEAIQRALKIAGGDRSKAAIQLGIHLSSLYRKMTKYNVD
ncbi:transcriptional regulator BkdR [Geomicrobium sp. JCM 19037]|uniref:sigma-54 interaction domain-containing protein n=1 Tax=Geomicrobium sp. JCM 19037 TaxID=1460634 RepID=UPI00045F264B|nr:sigma 54-interacting transcriptional regulator [Geomicrobium sp. JCM 19037]GAK02161.1 transcriptional regulator BkdR [Geomicrobium sp. JCM 19037]